MALRSLTQWEVTPHFKGVNIARRQTITQQSLLQNMHGITLRTKLTQSLSIQVLDACCVAPFCEMRDNSSQVSPGVFTTFESVAIRDKMILNSAYECTPHDLNEPPATEDMQRHLFNQSTPQLRELGTAGFSGHHCNLSHVVIPIPTHVGYQVQ